MGSTGASRNTAPATKAQSSNRKELLSTIEDRLSDRVKAQVKDNKGNKYDVTVSVQDTSLLDNVKAADRSKLIKQLTARAEENTLNSNRKPWMLEPDAQEGKWTKTDTVPILYNGRTAQEIHTAKGYVTKIDGDNVYIHKGGDGWVVNYKGMRYKGFNTLSEAKAGAQDLRPQIPRMKNSPNGGPGIVFEALNKNNGKMSMDIFRKMNWRDLQDRLKG